MTGYDFPAQPHFTYQAQSLHGEQVDLAGLAQRFGTPLYVYSRQALIDHYQAFDQAFDFIDHQVCYAVKANSSLAVLQVLAQQGAGFDIVSGGELQRVLAAGGDPAKVVFSGVAKTEPELTAALQAGIACFNVESEAELHQLSALAQRLSTTAPISLRVNPDVDARTHPYISTGLRDNKFGVSSELVMPLYEQAARLPGLEIVGIDCHIGSQLTDTAPFFDALQRIIQLVGQLAKAGITLRHIDIGGGLGVQYHLETPPSVQAYAQALRPALSQLGLKVYMEPGRAIAANAGVLLTQAILLKPGQFKNFLMVDAAMNDLMRPALYQAWMDIVPVSQQRLQEPAQVWDVVGAVCETGDWLGRDRELAVQPGDYLAIRSAGAYGFTMSSNYNTRPRAAEIMVAGDQVHVIRQREPLESLWQLESLLPADTPPETAATLAPSASISPD